jgi:hypothetical protein
MTGAQAAVRVAKFQAAAQSKAACRELMNAGLHAE